MTDQELLQQAKDQVAEIVHSELYLAMATTRKNWGAVKQFLSDEEQATALERAALLAIQSAREEAVYLLWMTDGREREELQGIYLSVEDAKQAMKELKKTAGNEQVFFTRVEPKKLTAPGR